MAINFNKVEFILSAASEKQFVRDGMPQLAFAGRSNVGKSSVTTGSSTARTLPAGCVPGQDLADQLL